MKNKYFFFALLFSLLNAVLLNAQNIPSGLDSVKNRLVSVLTNYYKRYPQEKLFLHTDGDSYLTGQNIWYKAYVTAYGKPSALSKIAYVRLSDANGKTIIQNKLELKNGSSYGDIIIPDSLPTGWFQIHAFTAWMLNFDEEGVYYKKIHIQNLHNHDQQVLATELVKTYHVNFFPEGGDLVDGNTCNIAFKATDENGLPVTIKGMVMSNKKTITNLVTQHDGMGSFTLEAHANENYLAQVYLPDNSVQNIALPKVKTTGLTMDVNNLRKSEFDVKIPYINKEHHHDIILTAMQNNGLSINYPLTLSRGLNIFSFKKNLFSTGILRLTVFDKSGLPQAERIIFIDNNDQLNIFLKKDTLSLMPRGKNVFTLKVMDNNNQPFKAANFSVAVTDAAMVNTLNDNIYTYFLLSSELQGFINQPAYYFKNNSDTLRKHLDLLMLTNGWRHFKWDTMLQAKPETLKYYIEKAQFIAGKIENYNNKDKLSIRFIILNEDSTKFKTDFFEPDSIGRFLLKDYNYHGNSVINYDVLNSKKLIQGVKVNFLRPKVDSFYFKNEKAKNLNELYPVFSNNFLDSVLIQQNFNKDAKDIVLKTVVVKALKLNKTELLIKNHVKHLQVDNATTLDLINKTYPAVSVFDYIEGRFPGLQVLQTNGKVKFFYRGNSTLNATPNSDEGDENLPYFYVDEALASLNEVENMQLIDIALIRFVPPPVYFAPLNGGITGALLIYTKRFGDEKASGVPSSNTHDQFKFNSFSVTREFPVIDYGVVKDDRKPDYRTTLYWSHDLYTDDKGNIKFHFYNSDKPKSHKIVVQAMDADGRVGFFTEEY